MMDTDRGVAGESRRRGGGGERESLDLLPPELWTEILVRLPVRTLLTLKCVCKPFLSLIQNPNFASLHFSRFNTCYSESNDAHLLFLDRVSDSEVGVCRGNASTKTIEFKIPKDKYYPVLGYVDGLFWLYRFNRDATLCNPSIRQSLLIPPPPSTSSIGPSDGGFGYDPLTHDYKAVVVVLPIPTRRRVTLVDVYSLRIGSWRSFEVDYVPIQFAWISNVYANGAIHWMARDYGIMPAHDLHPHYSHVVSFDLGNEVFSSTELPQDKEGSVKLPILFRGLFGVLYISESHISVWVIAENGWTKECVIESSLEFYSFLCKVHRCYFKNAIFSEKTSELLIAADVEGVISYNVYTKEYKTSHQGVIWVGMSVENLLWSELLPSTA